MATHTKNELKKRLLSLLVANYDLRVILCMTNTTADTDNDGVQFVSEIGTLDEFDGANYARAALAGETASKDDANDRGELTVNATLFSALGAGTRSIAGALIYHHVGADSANPALMWLEKSITPDGNDVLLKWDGNATAGAIFRTL